MLKKLKELFHKLLRILIKAFAFYNKFVFQFNFYMEYLQKEIFGNPLKNWIIAFWNFRFSYVLLKSFLDFSNIFQKLATKTNNTLDDVFNNITKANYIFSSIVSVLFAENSLSFSPKIELIIKHYLYIYLQL